MKLYNMLLIIQHYNNKIIVNFAKCIIIYIIYAINEYTNDTYNEKLVNA